MHDWNVAEKAADIAKEIVVSKMSNSSYSATEENGKQVAAFYNAIYKSIFETLKHDLSRD